jgi:cytochrome b
MSEKLTVSVWDPLVRIFHWSLVICFAVAYLTGEEESDVHIYVGYAVLGLVVFRVLWGLVGTAHARFRDFVFGPGKVIAYVRSLTSRHPQYFLGHNPAAGYMIVLLLVMLLIVTLTGIKAYGVAGYGPLAQATEFGLLPDAMANEDDKDRRKTGSGTGGESEEEFWEEVHEVTSNFTLVLIILHILGVIVASRLHRENLIKAMITGKKAVRSEID